MSVYRRKLSREDDATGSILIEKRRWRHFPDPMREFAITVAGKQFATRIVAADCACVPPPHQHYHLEAGHLRDLIHFHAGATVEIELRDGEYVLRSG